MLKKFWLLFVFFFQGEAIAAKSIPPPPSNYVYDETGLLRASTDHLSSLLSKEDHQSGNQILVALFNSLEQEDLVDYTNRVFQTWQPGENGKNNGVLLAVYLKERKIRIEVGYGLEPLLTDAKSKRILINIIGPAFGERKYAEGIIGAVQEIQTIIHSDTETSTAGKTRQRRPLRLIHLIFVGLFFIIIYFLDGIIPQTLGSHGIQRRGGGWGGFGGGGFGGGGFGGSSGGGGFSGGGGSSGGGGASGDW